MLRSMLVLLLAAPLIVPAAAGARTYHGRTSQGRSVSLTLDARGSVQRMSIGWRAPCSRPGSHFTAYVRFGFRPSKSKGPTLTIVGEPHFRTRAPHGFDESWLRFKGHRVSLYRWAGTISPRAAVHRRGKVIARCHARGIRWSATIPYLSARITEAGTGRVDTYRSPEVLPRVEDEPHGAFSISFPDWRLFFGPKHGQRLHGGTSGPAYRYPFNVRKLGLDAIHGSLDCNRVTGSLHIKDLQRDRHGRLRSFHVTFIHHCEGALPATRGDVVWRHN